MLFRKHIYLCSLFNKEEFRQIIPMMTKCHLNRVCSNALCDIHPQKHLVMSFKFPYTVIALFRRRMREQKAHTLSVVCSPDCLGQCWRDIHDLEFSVWLVTAELGKFVAQGYGVGNNESLKHRVVDDVDCVAREDTVGNNLSRLLLDILQNI